MFACIIMIESPRQSFAFVDDEIELKLVGGPSCGIQSRCVFNLGTIFAGFLKLAAPSRSDPGGAVEELRQLRKCDRSLVVKVARRMPVAQELCGGRNRLRASGAYAD